MAEIVADRLFPIEPGRKRKAQRRKTKIQTANPRRATQATPIRVGERLQRDGGVRPLRNRMNDAVRWRWLWLDLLAKSPRAVANSTEPVPTGTRGCFNDPRNMTEYVSRVLVERFDGLQPSCLVQVQPL